MYQPCSTCLAQPKDVFRSFTIASAAFRYPRLPQTRHHLLLSALFRRTALPHMHLPTCHRQKNGSLTRVTCLGKNNENWASRQGYPTRFQRQTIWEGNKNVKKQTRRATMQNKNSISFTALTINDWLLGKPESLVPFFFSVTLRSLSVSLSLSLSFFLYLNLNLSALLESVFLTN